MSLHIAQARGERGIKRQVFVKPEDDSNSSLPGASRPATVCIGPPLSARWTIIKFLILHWPLHARLT